MSQLFASDFKRALIRFINEPDNLLYKNELIINSLQIYNFATQNNKIISADNYMEIIANLLEPFFINIKICEQTRLLLDNLLTEISLLDDDKRSAFYAITMAHNHYLIKNLVSSRAEENVYNKLSLMQDTIEQLRLKKNPAAAELDSTYKEIEQLINQHFSLSPQQRQENFLIFAQDIRAICQDCKKSLTAHAQLQTIFYNLSMAIIGLGIFYGIYLTATAHKRGSFFLQPAHVQQSLYHLNNLSDFEINQNETERDESDFLI